MSEMETVAEVVKPKGKPGRKPKQKVSIYPHCLKP